MQTKEKWACVNSSLQIYAGLNLSCAMQGTELEVLHQAHRGARAAAVSVQKPKPSEGV